MLPAIQNHHLKTAHVPKAAFLLLGALLLYTIQDAIIKSLPSKYSVFEIIFFRSLFSIIPIALLGFLEKNRRQSFLPLLKTKHLKGQILRAALMFLALIFYFMACRTLPLASLYTLSYTSPLFMTILAVPFLGEKISVARALAVVVGFVGVFVVLQPGSDTFQLNGFYAVVSGFFTGISVIIGKRLCAHDSNTLLVAMYTLVSLIGSLIILPFVWVMPTLQDLLLLLLVGIFGGVAQYGFTQAFRIAPISSLAPFDYCGLIWAVLAGFFLWNDIPSIATVSGAFLIVSMGLFTLYQERKEKLSLNTFKE